MISTNDVINTNNCFISVCKTKYKNKLIILSAIDNLIKGGAGQAIQNLNIKFNFPIKTALNEINFYLLLLLLNNCSLNQDSKYWTEDVKKKRK